jgi:beta-lactamase class A
MLEDYRGLVFVGAVLMIISGAGGYVLGHRGIPTDWDSNNVREGGYTFVNPLLACDVAEDTPYPGFATLKNKLQGTVDTLIAEGSIKRVGVYFRNMDQGTWTGVNPDDAFIPGSLMKVPLMIAYLKDSQGHPDVFQKEVSLTGSDGNAVEEVQPPAPLHLGASYLVQDLVDAMITQSDNNAATVLVNEIATTTLNDVYAQFGIPGADATSETTSPKSYMRLFRILYNASYLWRGNSQKALELLSKAAFTDGIVAGVTDSTPVAHKFGEREIVSVDPLTKGQTITKRELHDCGIVYFPKHPYGICIMTEGADLTSIESAIKTLSGVAYDAVAGGLLNK